MKQPSAVVMNSPCRPGGSSPARTSASPAPPPGCARRSRACSSPRRPCGSPLHSETRQTDPKSMNLGQSGKRFRLVLTAGASHTHTHTRLRSAGLWPQVRQMFGQSDRRKHFSFLWFNIKQAAFRKNQKKNMKKCFLSFLVL